MSKIMFLRRHFANLFLLYLFQLQCFLAPKIWEDKRFKAIIDHRGRWEVCRELAIRIKMHFNLK